MASTAGTQQTTTTTQGQPSPASGGWVLHNGKWLAGYLALWLILEGMVEAGAGELAAAIAVVSVGTSFIVWGPKMLESINALVA